MFIEVKRMRVAVIGSRNLKIEGLENFIPKETVEIIPGGALGIDTCAKKYAIRNKIKLIEYFPNYKLFGRVAPLKQNITIIENSDIVIAFWDEKSKGTKFVIDNCKRLKVPVKVYIVKK